MSLPPQSPHEREIGSMCSKSQSNSESRHSSAMHTPERSANVALSALTSNVGLKTPSDSNTHKSIFLTPCRRVGLKRKSSQKFAVSPSNTPPTIIPQQNNARSDNHQNLSLTHCSNVGLSRATPVKSPTSNTMPVKKLCHSLQSQRKSVSKPICKLEISEDQYSISYLENLEKTVKEKQDELSSKHQKNPQMQDSSELERLACTWREACQAALEDLLGHVRAEQCSSDKQNMAMGKLLQHLDIPATLVKFDPDTEEFH